MSANDAPKAPWWASVPRDQWQQATHKRKLDLPPPNVRAALRWVEEHQAALEARAVGMRMVTYR